jgi:leader peptidase (prepilin peptidase) / N-methyltransferase
MTAVNVTGWSLVGLGAGAALTTLAPRAAAPSANGRSCTPRGVLAAVVTATLFALLAWRIGTTPDLLAYSWLAAIGVLLAITDWTAGQLPTKLIVPGYLVLIVLLAISAALDHRLYPLVRSVGGMVALLVFYGVLYLVFAGQLGGGDLRLGGLLGLALGWAGWTALLSGTLLGWSAAAVSLLVLRMTRRTPHDGYIRLGPFLLAGALAALLIQPTS